MISILSFSANSLTCIKIRNCPLISLRTAKELMILSLNPYGEGLWVVFNYVCMPMQPSLAAGTTLKASRPAVFWRHVARDAFSWDWTVPPVGRYPDKLSPVSLSLQSWLTPGAGVTEVFAPDLKALCRCESCERDDTTWTATQHRQPLPSHARQLPRKPTLSGDFATTYILLNVRLW